VQAYQCKFGRHPAAVFAAFAIRTGEKIVMIDSKHGPISNPAGVITTGDPDSGTTIWSEDNCNNVYFKRKQYHVAPNYYMDIALKMNDPSGEGTCNKVLQHTLDDDVLFSKQQLYDLCSMCGVGNCDVHNSIAPKAHLVVPASAQAACDDAKVSYTDALDACQKLSQRTVHGEDEFLHDACIFDYCESGGSDSFVDNAIDSVAHDEEDEGLGVWLSLTGKHISQSSTAHNGFPSRAIDGNTATSWKESSCTHTRNEVANFWKVDLGQNYDMKNIKVTNRGDRMELADRLNGFTVKVDGQVCASGIAIGTAQTVIVPCVESGDSLEISVPRQTPLTICEVEIFVGNRYNR